MSRMTNTWSRHYQSVWHERAGDPRLPYWFRVAALAYGSHAANGHATFKPGQVSLVLGKVDPTTGEFKALDKGSTNRAINAAIEYGLLSAHSGARCLVVPAHAIEGGMGSRAKVCPLHGRKRVGTQCPPETPKVGTQRLPSRHSAPTDNPVTSTNVTALYDSSLSVSAPHETEAAS